MRLVNISGNIECVEKVVKLSNVNVNQLIAVEVELIAPDKPGTYISEWILMYEQYMFGPRIWCAIEVMNEEEQENDVEAVDKIFQIKLNQLEADLKHLSSISNVDYKSVNNNLLLTAAGSINSSRISSSTISADNEQLIRSVEFHRKLSSSTRIDESENKNLLDVNHDSDEDNDEDDNEFVIIPECLDLNKNWMPNEKYFEIKEANLIDNNLMTFSTSVTSVDKNNNNNETCDIHSPSLSNDDGIDVIKANDDATLIEENKNLLIFSTDFANMNIASQNTNVSSIRVKA